MDTLALLLTTWAAFFVGLSAVVALLTLRVSQREPLPVRRRVQHLAAPVSRSFDRA